MDIRMMKREIQGLLVLFVREELVQPLTMELIRGIILGDNPTDASMARFERAKNEVADQLGLYALHRKRWRRPFDGPKS